MTSLERLLVMSFDESTIDPRVTYNFTNDAVYGPNDKMQVVMVRSLCSHWKQPVFFDSNNDARLAQSRAARLSALLCNTQLGDQKPTQLLLRMRSELGEEAQDSELLRTLFLQRLPRAATAALSLLPEDTSLSQLAAAADRYLEATGSHELAAMQLTGSTASARSRFTPMW
ncbi:Transposable element P transposase [Amphibalanus amphitrite]|uniref:Transposable element P transposase n=1 Tax=Amphibalanus amphitrite TaxID=1232801 RepID=A0A6A4WPJ1_AMPAM|nr:Transposable element P transposase [Amphibalanus amphitrite]